MNLNIDVSIKLIIFIMKCVYRMARTIKVVNKLKETSAANTTTNTNTANNFSMPYGDDDGNY